jgi:GNAT superfamily N-acetyltransferase
VTTAIFGTPGYVELAETFDLAHKLKVSGDNTGNLVFQHAVAHLVDGPKVFVGLAKRNYQDAALSQGAAAFLFPCANMLRASADWTGLNGYLQTIKLPMGIFGLGVQAKLGERLPDLIAALRANDTVMRLVAILREKARFVGVRGPMTAEVCHALGLRDVIVTGCPSLVLSPEPTLGRRIAARLAALRDAARRPRLVVTAAALRELGGTMLRMERRLVSLLGPGDLYVQQSGGLAGIAPFAGEEGAADVLDAEALRRRLLPDAEAGRLGEVLAEHGRIYFSVERWLEETAAAELFLGSRLHGNMIGLQSGTPAAVIVHDARTSELMSQMRMPRLEMEDFLRAPDLAGIVSAIEFDAAAFDAERARVAAIYAEELPKLGVPVTGALRALAETAPAEAAARQPQAPVEIRGPSVAPPPAPLRLIFPPLDSYATHSQSRYSFMAAHEADPAWEVLRRWPEESDPRRSVVAIRVLGDFVDQVETVLAHAPTLRLLERGAALMVDSSTEGHGIGSAPLLRLHEVLERHGVSPEQVVILTQNENGAAIAKRWGEARGGWPVPRICVHHYYLHRFIAEAKRQPEPAGRQAGTQPEVRFVNLNHKARAQRAVVLGHLARTGLAAQGWLSLSILARGEAAVEAAIARIARDATRLFPDFADDIEAFGAVAREAPLRIPHDDAADRVFGLNAALHARAGLSLVTETEMSAGAVLRFTEKTLKPLANGQPFLVAGSFGVLGLLRRLGFQTFGPVFDEAYDEVSPPPQRLRMVLAELTRLCALSDTAFLEAMDATLPACEHNRRHLRHGLGGYLAAQEAAVLAALDAALGG